MWPVIDEDPVPDVTKYSIRDVLSIYWNIILMDVAIMIILGRMASPTRKCMTISMNAVLEDLLLIHLRFTCLQQTGKSSKICRLYNSKKAIVLGHASYILLYINNCMYESLSPLGNVIAIII